MTLALLILLLLLILILLLLSIFDDEVVLVDVAVDIVDVAGDDGAEDCLDN